MASLIQTPHSNIACIDYFDISCDLALSHRTQQFRDDTCAPKPDCGCNDVLNNTQFVLDIEDGSCYYSQIHEIVCDANTDCVIDCGYGQSHSCNSTLMDGSVANQLTINCLSPYACNNSLIHCPSSLTYDSICSVLCDAS
eukprot:54217_1